MFHNTTTTQCKQLQSNNFFKENRRVFGLIGGTMDLGGNIIKGTLGIAGKTLKF